MINKTIINMGLVKKGFLHGCEIEKANNVIMYIMFEKRKSESVSYVLLTNSPSF